MNTPTFWVRRKIGLSKTRLLFWVRCTLILSLWTWQANAQQINDPQAKDQIPGIIIDQDMSSDHDDVGDLVVLNSLANLGECKMLACIVDSRNGGTALCMNAINTYYGHPDVPIGVPADIGGLGEYCGQIASEFPHPLYKSYSDCPNAVDLYRKVLAGEPDNSVIIVTTGYLNVLADLLRSGPDKYSTLNGSDLVKKKVKIWACAGGCYPKGDEFNFKVIPEGSFYTVNHWPAPAAFVGYDVGQAIYTGGGLPRTPKANPARRVYVDIKNQYPYPSWSQIIEYYAIRTAQGNVLWNTVAQGHNNCDEKGSNWWSIDPSPIAHDQAYLKEKVRCPVQESIEALMMLPSPAAGPSAPGQPSDLRTTVDGNKINLAWTKNSYNEDGFKIERGSNGVFTEIGEVGAKVTTYNDNALTSTANIGYRVKAFNSFGDSEYTYTWVYSGWTEVNFVPLQTNPDIPLYPLYAHYQSCDLRPIDPKVPGGYSTIYNHVAVNNDSTHGQDVTISVAVGALANYGNFYVYFFYQDVKNWYRLKVDVAGKSTEFEKSIDGTVSTIGSPGPGIPPFNSGSKMEKWQVVVDHLGTLQFNYKGYTLDDHATTDAKTILTVSDKINFTSGKIGLGGNVCPPLWENFHFETVGAAPAAH